MASYTKLNNGEWGVRAEGKLAPGATVTVTKKDGSRKTETVDRVLWTGPDKHTGKLISLCAIAPLKGNGGRKRDDDTVRCRHCGERTPEGDDWCMVCGKADYER